MSCTNLVSKIWSTKLFMNSMHRRVCSSGWLSILYEELHEFSDPIEYERLIGNPPYSDSEVESAPFRWLPTLHSELSMLDTLVKGENLSFPSGTLRRVSVSFSWSSSKEIRSPMGISVFLFEFKFKSSLSSNLSLSSSVSSGGGT